MGIKMWLSPLVKNIYGAPSIPMPNKGWETGDAGGWTFSGSTGLPLVSNANPRTGTYAWRCGTSSSGVATGKAVWSVDAGLLPQLKGRTVKFTVYGYDVLIFAGGAGSYQRIGLDDGSTVTYQAIPFTPYSTWNLVTCTKVISAAATKLAFIVEWYKAGGGRIYRLDVDDMDAVAS